MSDYPPVGFYFQLSFTGISGKADASFKDVSGFNVEMGTEEIAEGGENSFKHRVPTGAKYQNLVLKKALVQKDSELTKWCMDTINGGLAEVIKPKTIIVMLLNEKGQPLKSWSFYNAWPVKWDVSSVNSMNNELVIENIEFAFSYYDEK